MTTFWQRLKQRFARAPRPVDFASIAHLLIPVHPQLIPPSEPQIEGVKNAARGIITDLVECDPDQPNALAMALAAPIYNAIHTLTVLSNSMGDDPARPLLPLTLSITVSRGKVSVAVTHPKPVLLP